MDPEIDRGTIALVMAEALHYSKGRVIWTPPPHLEVEDPYDVLDRFPSTVRELLALAVLLREQAAHPGSTPYLTLVTDPGSGCLTCGDPVFQDELRCPFCALAVELALDWVPPPLAVARRRIPNDEATA
jgi:hypothetical protein